MKSAEACTHYDQVRLTGTMRGRRPLSVVDADGDIPGYLSVGAAVTTVTVTHCSILCQRIAYAFRSSVACPCYNPAFDAVCCDVG